jgi:hypothetical protein
MLSMSSEIFFFCILGQGQGRRLYPARLLFPLSRTRSWLKKRLSRKFSRKIKKFCGFSSSQVSSSPPQLLGSLCPPYTMLSRMLRLGVRRTAGLPIKTRVTASLPSVTRVISTSPTVKADASGDPIPFFFAQPVSATRSERGAARGDCRMKN